MTAPGGATMTQMSAAALSVATYNDPQFRLPERPCLVPAAVLVWLDDELVVEGTGSRRVISGKSARRLLPDLLPLLDGCSDVSELAAALAAVAPAATVRQVRAVLLLLYSCGLLQEGPMPVDPTEQELLLSRLLDTTRVNLHVDGAQARLRTTTVAIAAPPELQRALLTELASVQIGATAFDTQHPAAGQPDLVVAWVHATDDATARMVTELAADGVAVLVVGPRPDGVFFGPYAAPDHGPCPACVLAQTDVNASGPSVAATTVAALIAIECVALLARVGAPATVRGQVRVPAQGGRSEVHFLPPRPGCPHCGDPAVPIAEVSPAYRYEASVAFPARRLVNPRDHQHHFEAANIALQFDRQNYPTALATIALPDADLTCLDQAHPDDVVTHQGGPTFAALGSILAAAAGLKPVPDPTGKPSRWAPTGGNLGSPTLLLLIRDVPSLVPGVYAYQPVGHELVLLRRGLPAGWERRSEPVTVVFTGALFRVARKYRTFAYRIVHLDAGVALAHVQLVARRWGISVVNETAWPDADLRRALNLSFDTDTITAVLALGGAT
jgi:SagB-type dehydrogenase family enzyme